MDHKELDVWKEAMKLVKMVYALCKSLPAEEKFGLISQMKRAAISVPSNISEGAARKSNKELIQYCYISLGSLSELETQVILAGSLFSVSDERTDAQIEICRKLLLGFVRHLRRG